MLGEHALQLRHRIHEAAVLLGMDFPVYVVLTRCDVLPGFVDFFRSFPGKQDQMLGYVVDPWNPKSQQDNDEFDPKAVCEQLVEDLYDLQFSVLRSDDTVHQEDISQRVFSFPDEFRALIIPLQNFLNELVNPSRSYYFPHIRGLFFTSAQQQGDPVSMLLPDSSLPHQSQGVSASQQPYFIHDLIATRLKNDHGLVCARRPWWRRYLVALVASLVLGLLLGFAQQQVYQFRSDGLLAASCEMSTQQSLEK
ncbi:hypothetical protein C2W62_27815 [Candidatus Entotheonella serta]|nr:hypothetical protein C2W62_27815 [Candidatus Entotheonella serta]